MLQRLNHRWARVLIFAFGTVLVVAVAASAFYRGADPVEVGATLLFVVVLIGLSVRGVAGGVAGGLLASAIYLPVRFVTLGEVAAGEFVANSVVRVLMYVGLGAFGGWANTMLTTSLRKLDLYDEVDDVTGVGNARALLGAIDREIARADRYQTVFSLVVMSIQRQNFARADEKRAAHALRSVCQRIEASVRTTDLVNRVPFDDREDVTLMLPETADQGATTLAERLSTQTRQLLSAEGIDPAGQSIHTTVYAFPGDDADLDAYTDTVREVLAKYTVTDDIEAAA